MRAIHFTACLLAASVPAAAAETPGDRAGMLDAAIRCTTITDPGERVACYDAAVGRIAEASRSGSVALIDKAEVTKARRSLFGFPLPDIRLFGGGKDVPPALKPEAVEKLETKIASVGQGRGLLLTLEEGGTWRVIDEAVPVQPKAGEAIAIRRGAMGGYLANIAGRRALRVQRVS